MSGECWRWESWRYQDMYVCINEPVSSRTKRNWERVIHEEEFHSLSLYPSHRSDRLPSSSSSSSSRMIDAFSPFSRYILRYHYSIAKNSNSPPQLPQFPQFHSQKPMNRCNSSLHPADNKPHQCDRRICQACIAVLLVSEPAVRVFSSPPPRLPTCLSVRFFSYRAMCTSFIYV